ncbi:hypothetical protein, partial [Escherichia coli]|uniref:hypothetical protein n=1 Tax=Escherichia coli TaxID=562 RepID=UPI00190AAC02
MDYHFENLGDERFQKLCQATVAAKFPNVQSFPVGQADGGRDAVSAHDGGFIVFQVKYSETYRGREARAIVNSVIKSESAKVRKLISRGATSYYFLTNIEGSATLDTGTIDQVNDLLTQEFGIPSYCWWRNDIERLVETIPGLVWRYPEMLRATDFLEILANNSAHHGSKKTYDVFRLYMASQFVKEADVKFQQVQIQSKLAEIFTDTPLALARDKQPDIENLYCESAILPSAIELLRNNRYYFHGGSTYFAADWLARSGPTHGVQRLVLEGAPGQGKSTVTQYLCQLHRGRSLGKPV